MPDSFVELGDTIKQAYESLIMVGTLVPAPKLDPPKIPLDFAWAKHLGLVRRRANNFVSSISIVETNSPTGSGVPISAIWEKQLGIGGVESRSLVVPLTASRLRHQIH